MVRRWLAVCLGAVLAAPAAAQPGTTPPGAVRGLPVAAQPGQDFPLPTDGLMAPAPVVPPRTAYQLPPAVQPPPGTPPRTRVPDLNLPEGASIRLPGAPGRQFQVARRYGRLFNISSEQLDANTQRIVFMGGVILSVSAGPDKDGKPQPATEFATDSAVVWVTGTKVNNVAEGFDAGPESKREVEIYLTGNVVIRTVANGTGGDTVGQTLRAEEIYYDVARNRAVAVNADLEMTARQVPDGVHLQGKEIRRLDRENWEILDGSAFSSKLPSDPGFELTSTRTTMRERTVQQTNIFGIPYRDAHRGAGRGRRQRMVTARNTRVDPAGRRADLLHCPTYNADIDRADRAAARPSGFGHDRIFGAQVYTTWDMYKLHGGPGRRSNHKWTARRSTTSATAAPRSAPTTTTHSPRRTAGTRPAAASCGCTACPTTGSTRSAAAAASSRRTPTSAAGRSGGTCKNCSAPTRISRGSCRT